MLGPSGNANNPLIREPGRSRGRGQGGQPPKGGRGDTPRPQWAVQSGAGRSAPLSPKVPFLGAATLLRDLGHRGRPRSLRELALCPSSGSSLAVLAVAGLWGPGGGSPGGSGGSSLRSRRVGRGLRARIESGVGCRRSLPDDRGSGWLTHTLAGARGSPGRLLLDWSPLLLESIPTNGVTLGGIHGMVASASPVLPRRDRGRAGSPG